MRLTDEDIARLCYDIDATIQDNMNDPYLDPIDFMAIAIKAYFSSRGVELDPGKSVNFTIKTNGERK
jgi:hypothetical protein